MRIANEVKLLSLSKVHVSDQCTVFPLKNEPKAYVARPDRGEGGGMLINSNFLILKV